MEHFYTSERSEWRNYLERPEEFAKRLNSFIAKTRDGKLIKGCGGVDKYYL